MWKRFTSVAALTLIVLAGEKIHAQTLSPKPATGLAAAFGAREYIEQISLSPDGTKIAFIAPTKAAAWR